MKTPFFLHFLVVTFILGGCGGPKTHTHRIKKVKTAPYIIQGVTYKPQKYYEYVGHGLSSHYGEGDVFHGRLTATGEVYDKEGMTAAHRTLPIPCLVKVTNLDNGHVVRLKVNDRGPFIDTNKRIIDVSARAARLLGFFNKGLGRVKVEVLVPESMALAQRGGWVNKAVMPSRMLPERKHGAATLFTIPVHAKQPPQPQKNPVTVRHMAFQPPQPRKSPFLEKKYGANTQKMPVEQSTPKPSKLPWFRQ